MTDEIKDNEQNEEDNIDDLKDNETEDNGESSDDDGIPTVEDYNALKENEAKLKKQNAKLYERAKKAEASVKEQKETKELNKSNPEQASDLDEKLDERFLKRDGYSDEDIKQLKVIRAGQKALGEEISLVDAVNHPLFTALAEKKKTELKNEKARLGASGSSRSSQTNKIGEMSDEEHKAYQRATAEKILSQL